jgi:hypothetical protein
MVNSQTAGQHETERDERMNFSIYEAIMLICFGAAWPFSIVKSWRSRSAKGKSVYFLLIVLVGYIAGILNKTTQGLGQDPVLVLYGVNALMVGIDSLLYFRNRRYDRT